MLAWRSYVWHFLLSVSSSPPLPPSPFFLLSPSRLLHFVGIRYAGQGRVGSEDTRVNVSKRMWISGSFSPCGCHFSVFKVQWLVFCESRQFGHGGSSPCRLFEASDEAWINDCGDYAKMERNTCSRTEQTERNTHRHSYCGLFACLFVCVCSYHCLSVLYVCLVFSVCFLINLFLVPL